MNSPPPLPPKGELSLLGFLETYMYVYMYIYSVHVWGALHYGKLRLARAPFLANLTIFSSISISMQLYCKYNVRIS